MTETAKTEPAAANGARHEAVSETVAKAGTTKSPLPALEVLHADAGDIHAETVTMEHASAESVTVERLLMEQSDAKRIDARSAQLDRSGALVLKADRAVLQGGTVGVATANEIRMVKSKALVTIAGDLRAEGGVKTLLQIGPVQGDVRTLLTPGTAAGFGAGLGIVLALASIVRRIFGRGA